MKYTLIYETPLPCNVEALFDFHADTNNLPLITPPDTKVDIIKIETPLKKGNQAILRIKKGFVSFVWELTFEDVLYPHLIIDMAKRSPFKMFKHEHHFIAIDERHSILRDKITFSLPFWPLSLLAAPFVKHDMNQMFAYRHAQTKAYLSHHTNPLIASKSP